MLSLDDGTSNRDNRILQLSRAFGYLFALTLFGIIGLAMIPNQFFIVSNRAVINAPVQVLASPIYGQVNEIDLQVGQVVNPGQVTASMSNPNQDETSVVGLRLEKLDLTERLNNRTNTFAQHKSQMVALLAQIDAVKTGVIEELSAVVENAAATVESHRARVNEQDALLKQQTDLAKKGIIAKISMEPLTQKREALQYELDAAVVDLKRQNIIRKLVEQGVYTGGPMASTLIALELQRKTLAAEIDEDLTEIKQMQDRHDEIADLVSREEKRLGRTEAASVVAQHHGQIVSVDASHGDFLSQGQPLARSLNCSESFVAAVYAGRDVTDLPIGTPAIVNIRSLGVRRTGHIQKIVRYFSSGVEKRYFESFPKADGHEVYVLVKLDDDPALDAASDAKSDDKFFGCHVGEEVVVSLGEAIITKVGRYYDVAVDYVLTKEAAAATFLSPQKQGRLVGAVQQARADELEATRQGAGGKLH